MKSLAIAYPELAKEFHPTKNGILSPEYISPTSTKRVWWASPCGHEWRAPIVDRVNGRGCTRCRVIVGKTDLASQRPDLAAEWDVEKNGELTPQMVTVGSHKNVYWKCKCGYEWPSLVKSRSREHGGGCPVCANKQVLAGVNDLASQRPDLAGEWHPTKNGDLTPQMVVVGSAQKVWWKCKCGCEWPALVNSRSREHGCGCPVCANKQVLAGVNDLSSQRPDLAVEWHPTKNGDLTPQMVTVGSHKKAWWICGRGCEWLAEINSRSQGKGCPVCANKQILAGVNDLASQRPDLAVKWHPTKNGDLTPQMVTVGSAQRVWWKCTCGCEWPAPVSRRLQEHDCPVCSGNQVLAGVNDLASQRPDLAAEWDVEKNGNLTAQMVTVGSGRNVHWLCPKGHSWEAAVAERSGRRGRGCPVCSHERHISFAEKAVFYYIKKVFPDALPNVKKDVFAWLGSMELDVYIPSLRLAVEYDGPLHTQKLDQKKNKRCEENGMTIVRIRSHKLQYSLHGSIDIQLPDDSDGALEDALRKVFAVTLNLYAKNAEPDINLERDRFDIFELMEVQEKSNSLAELYPNLAKEWHPTKNKKLTAQMVTPGSQKKAWWKCETCGHEWQTEVYHRTGGRGCKICARKKRKQIGSDA